MEKAYYQNFFIKSDIIIKFLMNEDPLLFLELDNQFCDSLSEHEIEEMLSNNNPTTTISTLNNAINKTQFYTEIENETIKKLD